MANTLNIIEPTLHSTQGHCYGYVTSLLKANTLDLNLQIWGEKVSSDLFSDMPYHPYFNRKLRKLQITFLYQKLLKKDEIIFVPTAGHFDLKVLTKLSQKFPFRRIALHFHQYNQTPKKLAELKIMAEKCPHFLILTPTESLCNIFKKAGFKHCKVVPCPVPKSKAQSAKHPFKHVAYIGDMRLDKGFDVTTKCVQYCKSQSLTVPFHIQASMPRSLKAQEACKPHLDKLLAIQTPWLSIVQDALSESAFKAQLEGAISLQLYDAKCYSDKFSGVTLESLYAGAPIITQGNTWISEVVKKFDAGIVIADKKPETILKAIQTIQNNYATFQKNAITAGQKLSAIHDPINTLLAIEEQWLKPKAKPSLSIAMITKNSGSLLHRTLSAVAPIASEIILVDDSSTDNTPKIVKPFGANIITSKDWPGFGIQKNRAIDACTQDWIFCLDADEVVTPSLLLEIKTRIAQKNPPAAFAIKRQSYFCGKAIQFGDWRKDTVTRIFQRGKAKYSDDIVHEVLQVNGKVETLSQLMQHYTVNRYEDSLKKMHAYSNLNAQKRMARGKKPSTIEGWLHGIWTFLRAYCIKLGFLDGKAGFQIAYLTALGSYYKYVKG